MQSILEINRDLDTLKTWSEQWLVNFNPTKTKYMVFSKKLLRTNYDNLFIGNTQLEEVSQHKQLGITFNNTLTWEHHINDVCSKAGKRIDIIKRLPNCISPLSKLHIYTTFIRPTLEYGSILFDNCTDKLTEKLEDIQRQATLAITRGYRHTSNVRLLEEVGLETLAKRRTKHKIIQLFKMKNNITPRYLSSLTPCEVGQNMNYNLRNAHALKIQKTTKNYYLKSFIPSTTQLWNNLPYSTQLLTDFPLKRKCIKIP